MPQVASKLRAASYKLRWGAGTVGVPATVRGMARLAAVRIRKPATVEVKLRSGGRLAFRNPSQLVPALLLFGDLIDPEYPFLRRIATPGWAVVDVGAAVGQFTVFATRIGARTVHAYEPSGANVESLQGNLALNSITDRVLVHQTALSESEGEAQFATQATTYLSRLDGDVTGVPTETVPVRRLDGELVRLGVDHVNVLKVNVAGFEPEVLGGAEGAFAAGTIDVLVVLISLRLVPSLERLQKYGYRVGFYDPRRERFHEIRTIDEETLTRPPSPARHVLVVRSGAIDHGLLHGVEVVAGD